MYLTPEVKKNFFKEFGKSEFDTGSSEGQIAMYTFRIKHLTEQLKKNKKDKATERALVALVSKRRKQLEYIKDREIERYRKIIKTLGIRK